MIKAYALYGRINTESEDIGFTENPFVFYRRQDARNLVQENESIINILLVDEYTSLDNSMPVLFWAVIEDNPVDLDGDLPICFLTRGEARQYQQENKHTAYSLYKAVLN